MYLIIGCIIALYLYTNTCLLRHSSSLDNILNNFQLVVFKCVLNISSISIMSVNIINVGWDVDIDEGSLTSARIGLLLHFTVYIICSLVVMNNEGVNKVGGNLGIALTHHLNELLIVSFMDYFPDYCISLLYSEIFINMVIDVQINFCQLFLFLQDYTQSDILTSMATVRISKAVSTRIITFLDMFRKLSIFVYFTSMVVMIIFITRQGRQSLMYSLVVFDCVYIPLLKLSLLLKLLVDCKEKAKNSY
jgi:hypothetical protein